MHRIIIALLAFALSTAPGDPTLHLFAVNDLGAADLMPGGRGQAVIELRSETPHTVTLAIGIPIDLVVQGARASTGTVSVDDRSTAGAVVTAHWTGIVSSTQPINVIVSYQLAPAAAVGDRTLTAVGTVDSQQIRTATLLRICCVSAPPPAPPGWRVYVPIIR